MSSSHVIHTQILIVRVDVWYAFLSLLQDIYYASGFSDVLLSPNTPVTITRRVSGMSSSCYLVHGATHASMFPMRPPSCSIHRNNVK